MGMLQQIYGPCIVDVIIKEKEASVTWTTPKGMDEIKVNCTGDEYKRLTFDFGDISNIKLGGTDNWGKDLLPLYVSYKKGDKNYDSVFVDNITIQEFAGENNWCKCYKSSTNSNVIVYEVLSENPSSEPRIAYFKHKTTDTTLKRGFYTGRNVASEWYVTVIQNGNPDCFQQNTSTSSPSVPSPSISEPSIPEPSNSNIDITQSSSGGVISYNDLIQRFNSLLNSLGHPQISTNMQLYSYLKKLYDRCNQEYTNPNSELFSSSTYLDIYNFRGNNNEYETIAYNGMQAWVIAIALSEIIPNYGTDTNNQTELFKLAYDIGGGRSYPLYGSYTLKGDVTITRLVAGTVYAIIRSQYSFDDIDKFRNEINGSIIDVGIAGLPEWKKLGLEISGSLLERNKMKQKIGYAINLNDIFPNAPGPFATNFLIDTKNKIFGDPTDPPQSTRMYPLEQPSSLFNQNTKNYLVDEAIDNLVTNNYNLFNDANINVFKRTIQAVADDADDVLHMFGNKTYYKYDHNAPMHSFRAGTENDSDGYFNGTFGKDITGKDLSSLLNDKNGNKTPLSYCFSGVQYITSHHRHSILDLQYGRRRPGQGETDFSCRCPSPGNNTQLNYLSDMSITTLVGSGTKYDNNGNPKRYYVDLNGNGQWDSGEPIFGDSAVNRPNLYPELNAHTYPSGHSSGCWGVALLLMEMIPDKYVNIVREAYSYSVSRTILRAHWNSDIIYGRMIATMYFPIAHALRYIAKPSEDFRTIYNNAKSMINGVASPVPPSVIWVNFKFINNTSRDLTLDKKVNLVLANPLSNGCYYGGNGDGSLYKGDYNRIAIYMCNEPTFTVKSHSDKTFRIQFSETVGVYGTDNNILHDVICGIGERNPLNPNKINWGINLRAPRNIMLYVNDNSSIILANNLDPNLIFKENITCEIIIPEQ